MRAIVLGCGTSSGVPRIGPDWGACDPSDPRNRRSRSSILVETATTRILVDTGPDMREQLIGQRVSRIDAVIWTHDHADHSHGIDDLRQLFHAAGHPINGYGKTYTIHSLVSRFEYIFDGNRGYPAVCDLKEIGSEQIIGDIKVSTINLPHGPVLTTGLKFEHDGKAIGYATDFSAIDDDAAAFFSGLDIWIVDALRREPHPTHPHLAVTLEAIARCRPKRAVLTHMDHSMDYATLQNELPAGVEPGFDGQVVE